MNHFKKIVGIVAFIFSISPLIAGVLEIKQNDSVVVNGKNFDVFISHEAIQQRIKELGQQIRNDYKESSPLFVCVLKG